MALTINTNIMSLNAQRNLSTSQTKLSSAIERLSSGNRINSAKDDAAGLAISTRFTTQINGLNRAVQNANDGISLSQTTESALDEVTNNLQRIRELAVQSTNASNSSSDRAALDAEVQQRLSEVTRIATQTNFNGMKVLDGSAQNLSFQVGANVGEVITVGLDKGMKSNQVGQLASQTVDVSSNFTVAADAAATKGTFTSDAFTGANYTGAAAKTFKVGNTNITLNTDLSGDTDGSATAAAIQAQLTSAGDTSVAVSAAGGKVVFTAGTAGAGAAPAPTGAGAAIFGTGTAVAGTDAVKAGDAKSLTIAAGAAGASIQLADGTNFSLAGTYKDAQGLADAVNSKSGSGISAYVSSDGKSLTISSATGYTVSGTQAGTLGITTQAVSTTSTLADSSVKTVDDANKTINRIDAALQSVSDLRSTLGAVQNRFESTISNLQNISQNLTSSKSAITDADFAQETANMSSAQILQQAGVSVLAQANQSQQIVTKLLQ
ncbi:flagellin [Luteibacter sp. 22Crub2.1]|uniref:flagellin N-terminal helical domain-containing protein n=1 Tax=Luteibacter sp. 22Crub2.1 TaxID=1283288 RepID=UPI0009A61762|nr:flagellin [Luteibacter sp. 22Crub2.1]SKB91903.1 flagellin [Luteibacter sp. 22Crub2.1]